MAVLKWMDPSAGHAELLYDQEVHDEVLAAERKFAELLGEVADHAGAQRIGRRAYRVTEEKGRRVAEPIERFDPEATEILVVSPMQGG